MKRLVKELFITICDIIYIIYIYVSGYSNFLKQTFQLDKAGLSLASFILIFL